jgi:hypothetical protein
MAISEWLNDAHVYRAVVAARANSKIFTHQELVLLQ